MKKVFVSGVIVVLAVVAWVFVGNEEAKAPDADLSQPVVSVSSEPTITPSPVTEQKVVEYTDSGYMPSTITIKKGETVIWKNKSSKFMWTASAVHPTHKVYPGTDIADCGKQDPVGMFDSCKGIPSGEEWSFGFDSVGTWKYHNHSRSSHTGMVVVE